MDQLPARATYTLQYREVLQLPGKGPTRVVCLSGRIWLTSHGERDDMLLDPDDTIDLDLYRDLVVQALATARFTVERVGGTQ